MRDCLPRLPRASRGRAVLLTPLGSVHLTQLPSCKHQAPISPLFATLTGLAQTTENTATLSPLFATLTDFPPVSPVFATHTKIPGGVPQLFPFWFTLSLEGFTLLAPRNEASLERSKSATPDESRGPSSHPVIANSGLAGKGPDLLTSAHLSPRPVDIQPFARHNSPSAPSLRLLPMTEEGE